MANDMGKKLRELRDARGLTQREVANAVGVTEATVSRWESGHINNMRRDKIEGLAKVLHVSPLVIMGKDGDTPAPPAAQPPTAPKAFDPVSDIFDDDDLRSIARDRLDGISPEEAERKKANIKSMLRIMLDNEARHE